MSSSPSKEIHDISIYNKTVNNKILKRCLLVDKKVLYKSAIDTEPLSLTLHAVNK